MQFSQEQITQLAPDEASAKAGIQLANPSKWVKACVHEKALWGDCQGSGKVPYQTFIDLSNIAFKCSCPSRKFPCKHGLGLLYLYLSKPASFQIEATLPDSIEEWISKRAAKAEPKEKKPVDEGAQQKRVEARAKKVEKGIEELRFWIKDMARVGIMNIPQNPYHFNQNMVSRMVDAQAQGFANQLRKLNKIDFYQEGWQKQLSKQLSILYLLTEAYQKQQQLDEAFQQEIASLAGWTSSKEDILTQEGIQDIWTVLSKTTTQEDNLKVEKTWLFGKKHQRFALILNFYVNNQLPEQLFTVGSQIHATLVYYPSNSPLRALVKQSVQTEAHFDMLTNGVHNMDDLLEVVSHIKSINPFLDTIPLILTDFKLIFEQKNLFIKDKSHKCLSLSNSIDDFWNILALTRGESFNAFATYENEKIELHSIWLNQKFHFIQ